ncbi:MAG: hypothetical protein ACLGHC_01130 [Alphaproteobacteria bacterium]
MRLTLPIVTLIALGACSLGLTDKQRDEAADIAGDVSADPDELAALQVRTKELEQRVGDLEAEIQRLSSNDKVDTANIDTLFRKSRWAEDAIDTLFENDRAFAPRIGIQPQDSR